jgi:ABC-2 type transport system ATP-binding protein
VESLSAELSPGVYGLLGANGAGKSTTVKAVLGLIRPDGGRIELFGRQLDAPSPADKRRMGVALAESGFSGELTVRDVEKVLAAFYPGFDPAFYRAKAEALGLPMNKKIKEFSTGMKAKLKVLAAISHGAELLLLDEPTAGLDVLARDQLLEMLREYVEADERRAILISSHISGDLEQLCDDFYMIDDGKIICHEDTDRLLSDYAIVKVAELSDVDLQYILRRRRESFGWSLLTDQKRFYAENYPGLVIERVTLDEFIMMMLKGETL